MVDKTEIQLVPAFADSPPEQLEWFLGHSQELRVAAGDTYVCKGDAAEWMFVILEGQFEWRGGSDGHTVINAVKSGDVTGVLPFSRMKHFNETFYARAEGRILKFPAFLFAELVRKMPELTS